MGLSLQLFLRIVLFEHVLQRIFEGIVHKLRLLLSVIFESHERRRILIYYPVKLQSHFFEVREFSAGGVIESNVVKIIVLEELCTYAVRRAINLIKLVIFERMLTFGVVRRVAVHSDQRRTWLDNI